MRPSAVKIAEIIDKSWLHEDGYYVPPLSKAAGAAQAIRSSGGKPVLTHAQSRARQRAKQNALQVMFPARNPGVPRPNPLLQTLGKLK
jgi:hypothetical protein